MVSTVRLIFEASYAVAVMALVGIMSGFAAAAITGDTQLGLQVALAMFALTGAWLTARLWRTARRAAPPALDAASPGARGFTASLQHGEKS